jgi:cell division protease FtsH
MAQKKPTPPGPQKANKIGNLIVMMLILLFVFSAIWLFTSSGSDPIQFSYTEFIEEIEEDNVTTIQSTPIAGEINAGAYTVTGTLEDDSEYVVEVPTQESLQNVIDLADVQNITYGHAQGSTYSFWNILIILLPIILIVIFIGFFMKRGGGNNKAFDFGKSKAKLNKGKTTKFDQVAALDEEKQEVSELIDFLQDPKKYMNLGARIPKGVLLVGPPGTGKTLLARAVAGEADVPFYSISGSDFVEMFVGVGASRVRDMFKTAKQSAPCIIFVDELDAVGRQRGAGVGGGNDEREQTLNQLLVEMDGFGPNSGIIVMAATNRPDVLDPALLRPGRFDRQITVGRPDIRGREQILQVHARNKKIDPNVTFEEIARRTPGFTGADLENLLNEAALLAAREDLPYIKLYHIDEAVDRVMMGPAKKSRIFTKRERDFIAHHEAGHAVLGLKLDNANVVHKVTIIPRGQAGGYNLMLPKEEESFLKTKKSLIDQITGLLGGRVAEEIIFNEVSTGAHNDFQRATEIARSMVTEYGMSSLGPVQYEKRSNNVFLGRDYNSDKSFSDTVALEIDNEVRNIINACYENATKVLTQHLSLLKLIASFLLESETLTREDIMEIVDTGKLLRLDKKREEKSPDNESKDTDTSDDQSTPNENKAEADSEKNDTNDDSDTTKKNATSNVSNK